MENPFFSKTYPIRFQHCDPAGIVYFPHYLVLTNWLVEDWFTEGLQIDFADLIGRRQLGLPLVKLASEFTVPSRHGDQLTLELRVERLGHRSLTVNIDGHVDGVLRMRSQQTMVQTCLKDGKSTPIPSDIRNALSQYFPVTEVAL